ncbi:hypothetical protein SGLAU_03840 [Streptomyces glaucescens]|uniref:Uncharacterized protein n=1 Tax=Streptomyces glaucescens TaxID=1907 RepID=A0A089X6U6_STRGA|nr:hypothetical protein SGLAU_03840 [Streptomyces glaucescens]
MFGEEAEARRGGRGGMPSKPPATRCAVPEVTGAVGKFSYIPRW